MSDFLHKDREDVDVQLVIMNRSYFLVHLHAWLNLCRYSPLRRTATYSYLYLQFLSPQWRYAVHLPGSNVKKYEIATKLQFIRITFVYTRIGDEELLN